MRKRSEDLKVVARLVYGTDGDGDVQGHAIPLEIFDDAPDAGETLEPRADVEDQLATPYALVASSST